MNLLLHFLLILAVAGALILGLGWVVWALYQAIAVPTFGAPALTFWQGVGSYLMLRLSFASGTSRKGQ